MAVCAYLERMLVGIEPEALSIVRGVLAGNISRHHLQLRSLDAQLYSAVALILAAGLNHVDERCYIRRSYQDLLQGLLLVGAEEDRKAPGRIKRVECLVERSHELQLHKLVGIGLPKRVRLTPPGQMIDTVFQCSDDRAVRRFFDDAFMAALRELPKLRDT